MRTAGSDGTARGVNWRRPRESGAVGPVGGSAPAAPGGDLVDIDPTGRLYELLDAQEGLLAQAASLATESPLRLDRDLGFDAPIEDQPCLAPEKRPFKNFRSMPELGLSASSQFTAAGLGEIKRRVESERGPVHMIVVDLREESHRFDPSGLPEHARGYKNWGNLGRNALDIHRDEAVWARSDGGRTEAQTCRDHGVDYYRVLVTDHVKPQDRQADQLVRFFDSLPAEIDGKPVHIHLHCKAGKGRTTTAAVMRELLLRPESNLAEVVARHARAGGTDLFKERNPDLDYKAELGSDKADFVTSFARYARDRHQMPTGRPGRTLSFSEWKDRVLGAAPRPGRRNLI